MGLGFSSMARANAIWIRSQMAVPILSSPK